MKKILVYALVAVFLLSFPGLPAKAQYVGEVETADAQYYGGVETTNFGVYDPEARTWVQVPVSGLPWWWTPPPDWVLWSTLGIATAAVVMSAIFIGGGLSFGSVIINDYRYRGRFGHFHHFRDNVIGPRFRTHYGTARRDAERRHPDGLRHPPGKHGAGIRAPGAHDPRSPGVRGSNVRTPGTRGPASGVRGPRGTSVHSPSTPGVRVPGAHGPRSPGVRGPNNVRSPGTRGSTHGVRGLSPVRQPTFRQPNRIPQQHRGPAMTPRSAPHRRPTAPAHRQAPRGGGKAQPQQQKKHH